jgi:hypothetical protein
MRRPPLSFRTHSLIAEPNGRAVLASMVFFVLLLVFGAH